MATTAAAKAPADIAPAAPKKSKLPLIIVAVVVVLALAAGAAWFFLARGAADEDDEPRVSSKPSVFLPLDQFTVNLQPEDGPQFLQVAMTLKLADQETSDAIKAQLPEVRSRVLLLLSSKKASQLTSPEGKHRLADEISQEVEAPLPHGKHKPKARKKAKADADEAKPGKKAKKAKAEAEAEEEEESGPARVQAVYFTHFIIQ
jgi:flagellar FliL protein